MAEDTSPNFEVRSGYIYDADDLSAIMNALRSDSEQGSPLWEISVLIENSIGIEIQYIVNDDTRSIPVEKRPT